MFFDFTPLLTIGLFVSKFGNRNDDDDYYYYYLIAPCMCDFSCALSELQVIARNCDWFIALFAPVWSE